MANPEHLEKFLAGPDVWNEWFKSQNFSHENRADLSNSDFSNMLIFDYHIDEVDFTNCTFEDAQLLELSPVGSVFTGSSFAGAYIFDGLWMNVELSNSNFFAASLIDVQFIMTSLENVFFEEGNITGCLFRVVNFSNSNFSDLFLARSSFFSCNFTSCSSLSEAIWETPCATDFETIVQSWPISNAFLRGCGFPDNLIDYLPSLMNDPIQFYSCFISYADKNRKFVDRLHNDMQGAGVRVWYAPEDLKAGDKLHPTFDRAIRVHDKVLIILSEESLVSPWVEDEVNRALAKERDRKSKGDDSPVLFPIMIDDAVMDSKESWVTYIKENRYIGDFRHWKDHDSYSAAFDRLMRDLKPAIMRKPGS